MPPCRTSPAPTPLQISLRNGIPAIAWLQAIEALAAQLSLAPTREALCTSVTAVGGCLRQWIDDQDVSPDDPAEGFWRLMLQREPSLAARLAHALSDTDRYIGRKAFERTFLSRSVAPSG